MPLFLKFLLLVPALSLLVSCAGSGQITNARICIEIPFIDGPEGACNWTVTPKPQLVNAADWKIQRKTMLMIDAVSWTQIKLDWLKACRVAGPDCNIQVDSVDSVITALDAILKDASPLITP